VCKKAGEPHISIVSKCCNLSAGVHGLNRGGGYRLQFVDRGKRDQKVFIFLFWTTIPTSTPFPSSSSPLDAIDIGAWPAKAQAS